MKKSLLALLLFLTIYTVNAQEVSMSNTSWPPTAVLPEKGDWSIGFDVVPIIRTVGNLFHTPSGNDSIYSQKQFTAVFLRVKNERTAYRFKARVGYNSEKWNNLVNDDASNNTAKVNDSKS